MEVRRNLDEKLISKSGSGLSKTQGIHIGGLPNIERTFNNVTTGAILDSLATIGISTCLTRWVENMLSTILVSSTLGDTTTCRATTRGTPQVCVLSLLLKYSHRNN